MLVITVKPMQRIKITVGDEVIFFAITRTKPSGIRIAFDASQSVKIDRDAEFDNKQKQQQRLSIP